MVCKWVAIKKKVFNKMQSKIFHEAFNMLVNSMWNKLRKIYIFCLLNFGNTYIVLILPLLVKKIYWILASIILNVFIYCLCEYDSTIVVLLNILPARYHVEFGIYKSLILLKLYLENKMDKYWEIKLSLKFGNFLCYRLYSR
jgi:hypothetical protein